MYNYRNNLLVFSFFLEKMPSVFWTNKALTPKHTNIYVPTKWLFLITQIIKNELSLNYNFLLENSALDLSSTQQFFLKNSYFKLLRVVSFYTFYFSYTKDKITIFSGNLEKYSTTLQSIDTIYNNAN